MKVLVSGYYGFGNLGDEALLSGLLGALRRRGVQAVVLSGDPAATTALHGVPARHRTLGVLGGLLESRGLISGGGGLLQDGTSQRSLRYYLGVIRLARLLRRPAVVYAQSLGPLSQAGRSRVAEALRGVPVMVRDDPSMALAASLDLPASLVADTALLLEDSDEGGTSGSDLEGSWRGSERGSNAVVAATGGPVILIPRGGQDDLNMALVRLAMRLVAAGERVQALAMHPVEDDREVARLVAAVPEVAIAAAATPAEALALLGAARYVVSVRLHGCILAARVGTGFAGLSYDPKVMGFLEQVSAPAFQHPVDEEALARAVLSASAAAGLADSDGATGTGRTSGPGEGGFDAVAVRRLTELAERGVDDLVALLRSHA